MHTYERRSFLIGAGAVGAGLFIGCGDDDTSSGRSATGADDGAFPVRLAGKEGDTSVPRAPRRVVAAGYLRDTDLALALRAPLVGTVGNQIFPSGLAPWQDPKRVGTLIKPGSALPFERIAALRPDLVLASDDFTLAADFSKLSGIAPTLASQRGVGRDGWREMTMRAGRVLGRTDQARALVRRTEAAIARTRERYPELEGRTFTSGPVSGPSAIFTSIDDNDISLGLFGELGMKLSPSVQKLPKAKTPGRAQVSLENLDALDADVVILTYISPSARRELEGREVFKRIPAVKRGSYVPLDLASAAATGFASVLSIPYALQTAVPAVARAAERAGRS